MHEVHFKFYTRRIFKRKNLNEFTLLNVWICFNGNVFIVFCKFSINVLKISFDLFVSIFVFYCFCITKDTGIFWTCVQIKDKSVNINTFYVFNCQIFKNFCVGIKSASYVRLKFCQSLFFIELKRNDWIDMHDFVIL